MTSSFTDRGVLQLRLLAEVVSLLAAASVPVWLSGGWALDFVVGEVTRGHDDIDLLIFTHDRGVAERALASAGYDRLVTSHPDEHRHFRKDGERISLTFVEVDERGDVVTPGRWRDWPYAEGALDGPTIAFGGVECTVLSVDAQLETKVNFGAHRSGAPKRPKDLMDITLLQSLAGDAS